MISMFKKSAIGLVDQGMSSLSNVLAVIMVAQSLSASAFGSFSVAYAVLIFFLTLSRSYFATQLTLTATPSVARDQARSALGALLILAPALAASVGGFGFLLGGAADLSIIVVVGIAAPLVCLQDALRYAALAVEKPYIALASDTVWAVIMVVPSTRVVQLTGEQVMGVWLAAAALALVVAAALLRIRPDFAKGWRLLGAERHVVGNSTMIGSAAVAIASVAIAAATAHFLGPTSAGSLRGASTAMGPLNVLLAFITFNLTSTLLRRQRSQDLAFCVRVALLVAVAVAVWSAVVLLLPDVVGRALLGESWPGARSVLPWTCAEYVFLGLGAATVLWLQVRYAARRLLQMRLIFAAVLGSFGICAAIFGSSAQSVAAAIACAVFVNATLSWLVVLRGRSLEFPVSDPVSSTKSIRVMGSDDTTARSGPVN
jgi:O-antigen/teichoic acid export membrane protein